MPTQMYSALDMGRERESIAEVTANVPEFSFNRWIDHESFCIALQSKFLPNEDRALLLKFAGTVESGTIAEYGDDGITQKATVWGKIFPVPAPLSAALKKPKS